MNSRKRTQKRLGKNKWGVARSSELEGSRFAVWQVYRLAAGGSRERLQRLPSTTDGSLLSQRALWTKPGVLTPGTCPKSSPLRGCSSQDAQSSNTPPPQPHFSRTSTRTILMRLVRAARNMDLTPGLNLRAQSFNPFGIGPAATPEPAHKVNAPHHGSLASVDPFLSSVLRSLRSFAAIPLHSYTRLTTPKSSYDHLTS
jgi:hypothetical protein